MRWHEKKKAKKKLTQYFCFFLPTYMFFTKNTRILHYFLFTWNAPYFFSKFSRVSRYSEKTVKTDKEMQENRFWPQKWHLHRFFKNFSFFQNAKKLTEIFFFSRSPRQTPFFLFFKLIFIDFCRFWERIFFCNYEDTWSMER